MGKGVTWYDDRIRRITTDIPTRAHDLAAAECAGLAAKQIHSSGTGTLARDVARVKPVGPMHSLVGSNLPYAGMEQWGGTIRPRSGKRLLIRGRRGSSRSTVGGEVVASATEVQHRRKRYLDVAISEFPARFVAAARRLAR